MVTTYTIIFPKSASPSVLLATLNVPYDSTDGVNKPINVVVPIGYSLSCTTGQVASQGPTTITISGMTPPATINVYKNGTLIGTTPNINPIPSGATTKAFNLPITAINIACAFNSYFYTISFLYTPTNPTIGATDVYTFYATLSYTMNSPITGGLKLASPYSYGIVVNTTQALSAFTNFSYNTGSVDSLDYQAYTYTANLMIAPTWDGTQPGYYPANYTTWSGLYQLDTLYANNIYSTSNLNFKKLGASSPSIEWMDTDANGGAANALIYVSATYQQALVFESYLLNGCVFSGGVQIAKSSGELQLKSTSYLNSAQATNITASVTLAYPLYEVYPVSVTIATTITLPEVTSQNIGTNICFRRVGGTGSIVVSFKANGTGNTLYSSTNVTSTSTGVQNLMVTGVYIVRFVSLGTAWYQV